MIGKLRRWFQKRRDRRFLRQLERVLDNNVLETNILFRGRIGGTYSYFIEDRKRNYGMGEDPPCDHLAKSDERFLIPGDPRQ